MNDLLTLNQLHEAKLHELRQYVSELQTLIELRTKDACLLYSFHSIAQTLIKVKYQKAINDLEVSKERAASTGNYKLFAIISQDIRTLQTQLEKC